MLRHERPVIQIFLPVLLVSMLALASVAVAQKVRRETVAYTPPSLTLVAEPAVITVCPSEGQAQHTGIGSCVGAPRGNGGSTS